MNNDQILYLVSLLCVFTALGFSFAWFLADNKTAAGMRRQRTTSAVSVALLLTAAGTSWLTGSGSGTFWFILAMTTLCAAVTFGGPTRSQIKQQQEAEQREHQQALEREAAGVDNLAAEFDLPTMPRLQPERKQT